MIQGYTKKDIQKITIIENILVCIISIVIAIISFEILKLLMNFVFNYIIQIEIVGLTKNEIKSQIYNILKVPQKVNNIFILIISLIIIFIEIINTYIINRRIFSKNISDMLKN